MLRFLVSATGRLEVFVLDHGREVFVEARTLRTWRLNSATSVPVSYLTIALSF